MTGLHELVSWALARHGRVEDHGLSSNERTYLRSVGARLFRGPGEPWWAVGEAKRLQLYAKLFETVPLRPDPDAEAFDGP